MTPKELRQAFEDLPPISSQVPLHTWPWHQYRIRQQVAEENPLKMLDWITIAATMHSGEVNPAQWEKLPKRYHRALTEPDFGGKSLPDLIRQAYHLYQWESKTGQQAGDLSHIVEFGGGFGVMALLCRRLGFEGQYTIIDLPEFSLLQKYYLSNTAGLGGFEFVSTYKGTADLLIALYSITEIPLRDRAKILKGITFDSCLIAHQTEYRLPDGQIVNNPDWSAKLVKRRGYRWYRWQNELMERHWYVIGEKD